MPPTDLANETRDPQVHEVTCLIYTQLRCTDTYVKPSIDSRTDSCPCNLFLLLTHDVRPFAQPLVSPTGKPRVYTINNASKHRNATFCPVLFVTLG